MILKSNGSKQDVKSKSIERRAKRDQPELNRTPESKVMAETVESRAAEGADRSGMESTDRLEAIGMSRSIGRAADRSVWAIEKARSIGRWSRSIG